MQVAAADRTDHRTRDESLILALRVLTSATAAAERFQQGGKGQARRARRALSVTARGHSAQQSGQSCAPVFSFPHSVATPGQRHAPRPVLSPCGDRGGGCGCGIVVMGFCYGSENVKCRLVLRTGQEPTPRAGSRAGRVPSCRARRWPHSQREDATDWMDAEDFPFLWFFCLF